ncbi:MAG: GntR family transcriptional regulator [Lautropia sp.]
MGASKKKQARTPLAAVPDLDLDEGQKRTWQRVLEELKRDIVYGRLLPKEHLVEDELMRRFSASRYAVHRALDELLAMGLAVRTENRGTRIRAYSPQEVLDLFEVREILETAALLRLPLPLPAARIRELAGIQRRYDSAAAAGDLYLSHLMNDRFWQALYAACPNASLADQIDSLSLQLQPVRMRFFLNEDRRKRASTNHWEIIEILKSGDNKRLAAICAQHKVESRNEFAKTVLDDPRNVPPRLSA